MIRLNYEKTAEDLIALKAEFEHLPVGEILTEFSTGEYLALHFLLSRGTARPSELRRFMRVSSARIAALLGHLENKELILRRHETLDERCISVILTDKGRDLIEKKRDEATAIMAKMLSVLGPNDAKEYLRLRRKLIEAAVTVSSEEVTT